MEEVEMNYLVFDREAGMWYSARSAHVKSSIAAARYTQSQAEKIVTGTNQKLVAMQWGGPEHIELEDENTDDTFALFRFLRLEREVEDLRQARAEAERLDGTWDEQAIGELMELGHGAEVRSQIAGYIEMLQRRLRWLETECEIAWRRGSRTKKP